jgi:hypothetical protein
MPVNITDVDTFTDPIVAPADSDPADRTYVITIAQGLANRTRWLKNLVDIITPRFDANDVVQLSPALDTRRTLALSSGQPLSPSGSPHWEYILASGTYRWRSLVNAGEVHFPINPAIEAVSIDGGSTTYGTIAIVSASVFWTPGAARTGVNRPAISLVSQTITAGAPAATLHATANGDASTTTAHTTTVTPASPITMAFGSDYKIAINGGNDAGTNLDLIHRVQLRCTLSRMPL